MNPDASSALPPILREGKVSLYRLSKPIGDALFLSTAAHEIRRRNPRCEIEVHAHWPELFHNNPDIACARPIREPHVPAGHPIAYDDPWPPRQRRHALRLICDHLGLDGDDVALRTYYYPSDAERQHARELAPRGERPLVVVHPFSGFFAPRTKQWDFSNWKALLDLMPHDIETMRFCNPDEPATPSERPFHRDIQTTDLRLMASLIEQADAFIGHDSGLAHLATALDIPAVVIFTGYVPPDVFGYEQNVNLVPDLSYIPCWRADGCEPCKGEVCTRAVTPEQALEALLGVLAKRTRGD